MLFDERMIWNYILFIEKIDDEWQIIHFVCWAWDSEWNIGLYSWLLVTKVNYKEILLHYPSYAFNEKANHKAF